MLRCGKTAQTAIVAASLLAERFDGGRTRLSSEDVAKARKIPKPLAAKVLSTLSTAGLLSGTRGPGGGYWLARPPARISLAEICSCFEKEAEGLLCPFGPGWCGTGAPCPMHDAIVQMSHQWEHYLRDTTLAVFVGRKSAPSKK